MLFFAIFGVGHTSTLFKNMEDDGTFIDGFITHFSKSRDIAGLREYFLKIDVARVVEVLLGSLADTRPSCTDVRGCLQTALKGMDYPTSPYRRSAQGAILKKPGLVAAELLCDVTLIGGARSAVFSKRYRGTFGETPVDLLRLHHAVPPEALLNRIHCLPDSVLFPPIVGISPDGMDVIYLTPQCVTMFIGEQIDAHKSGLRRWKAKKILSILRSALEAMILLEKHNIFLNDIPLRERMECDVGPDPSAVRLTDFGITELNGENRGEYFHVKLFAELISDLLTYRIQSNSSIKHAGPLELDVITAKCQSETNLEELRDLIEKYSDIVLNVAPPGCCREIRHEIPFISENLSYIQWSVPDEARIFLVESHSGALLVFLSDLLCEDDKKCVGLTTALFYSYHLTDLRLEGPTSTTVEDTTTTCILRPPTAKLSQLRILHSRIFEPSLGEGSYHIENKKSGFVEHAGIKGPALHHFVSDMTGRRHENAEGQYLEQEARWAEYLKLAQIVNEVDNEEVVQKKVKRCVFHMGASFWRGLAVSTAQLRSLCVLHITKVHIAPEQLSSLCDALLKTPIKKLALDCCGLSGVSCFTSVAKVVQNSLLEELCVTNNVVDNESSRVLMQAVGRSGLVALDLNDTGLEDVTEVACCMSLKELSMRGNVLGEAGAVVLADALRTAPEVKLNLLDLSHSHIGQTGLLAVVTSLHIIEPRVWNISGCLRAVRNQ